MSKRVVGLTFALIAVAAVSSSCLFSSRSAITAVRDATGRALDADSVHFEITTSIEGATSAEAEEFQVKAHGASDPESERSVFVFETYGITMELRRVGEFIYTRIDEDSEWLKVAADEFPDFDDLFMPLFDPYALLEGLGLDPASAKEVGSDEIQGNKAKRYSIDVPARDYDDEIVGFIDVDTDSTITFWIDEDGLPARLVIESTGDAAEFRHLGLGRGDSAPHHRTFRLREAGRC